MTLRRSEKPCFFKRRMSKRRAAVVSRRGWTIEVTGIFPPEPHRPAEIMHKDIDQLTIGQTATMRLSAFNQRVTPELNGTVEGIAPALGQDPKTGASFYSVRLKQSAKEAALLHDRSAVLPVPRAPSIGDARCIRRDQITAFSRNGRFSTMRS